MARKSTSLYFFQNRLVNFLAIILHSVVHESILEEVYDKVGGRLTFLNRVAKSENMIEKCDTICEMEKIWFLNNCAILGEEMDDDVMDQQKYAVCTHKLSCSLMLG